MLTVRGRYVDGTICLREEVTVEGEREVLVTFLDDEALVLISESEYEDACRQMALAEVALTNRECEVLQLLQDGRTNREIAIRLKLSAGTVRNYTSSIYTKLKVRNRLEAVNRALELGLLTFGQDGTGG